MRQEPHVEAIIDALSGTSVAVARQADKGTTDCKHDGRHATLISCYNSVFMTWQCLVSLTFVMSNNSMTPCYHRFCFH